MFGILQRFYHGEGPLKNATRHKTLLKDFFLSQSLAVLATYGCGQTYGSLVAFAATDDLESLLFATMRDTRKFANLTENPMVALVMDNRANQETDFHGAIAVTATGSVQEAGALEKDLLLELYLSKHPYLKDFVTSPACALLRLDVATYFIVSDFQNVTVLHIKK
ncbi:MAG: pyridoxamine 5'-phosphate oxidase family protein [Spirochaetes bacterium]|nr:pyridoxamine 5'-phosphate oxidase family protein [Spirochaetota bacterium]